VVRVTVGKSMAQGRYFLRVRIFTGTQHPASASGVAGVTLDGSLVSGFGSACHRHVAIVALVSILDTSNLGSSVMSHSRNGRSGT